VDCISRKIIRTDRWLPALALALLLAGRVQAGSSPAKTDQVPFPDWVLGQFVWEDESTTESVRALVKGFQENGIPIGGVIIDSPWETAYNTFAVDPVRYPGMKQMIADLHSQGIKVIFWVTCMVNTDDPEYEFARSHGFLVPGLEKVKWWKGVGGLLDYRNPEAVAWWHQRMDQAIDLGIDGWKVDGTDPLALKKGWKFREEYRKLYYSDFYNYTREHSGQKTVIMARALEQVNEKTLGLPSWTNPWHCGFFLKFAPQDVSYMSWMGDQDPSFDGLRIALANFLASARAGYLVVGTDVAGYRKGHTDKTLFIRWAQFGAFSPLLENGGIEDHRPWSFDRETVEIYRKYAKLRATLNPWLMEKAIAAYHQGRSLVTPLSEGKFEYLLGDDLLVAPIMRPDGKREVKFPEGSDWVWWFNGSTHVYKGGSALKKTFTLSEYPVYFRQGSSFEDFLATWAAMSFRH